jgi:TrmH family RNA methyltransferase
VVTTSAKARTSFWEAGYPRPLALLLGAEGTGLPDGVLAAGDVEVRIPMTGTAESLNLAVAAGLLLYQARKPDLTRLPGAAPGAGREAGNGGSR